MESNSIDHTPVYVRINFNSIVLNVLYYNTFSTNNTRSFAVRVNLRKYTPLALILAQAALKHGRV